MDRKKYFETYLPAYSLENFDLILPYLNKKDGLVLDIGCGNAQSLVLLKNKLSLEAYGMEESIGYRIQIPKNLRKKIFWNSILDDKAVMLIPLHFKTIILSRVLHHLVGSSPAKSFKMSQHALENSFKLLDGDGQIIISEPLFKPLLFVKLLFYIKRIVCAFTTKRIVFFNYWNNIGEPVISYFSPKSLRQLIKDYEVEEYIQKRQDSSFLIKIFFSRFESITIIKKKK